MPKPIACIVQEPSNLQVRWELPWVIARKLKERPGQGEASERDHKVKLHR